MPFFNACQDGNLHTYAATVELKKKAFLVNIQNKKQATGIRVTFMLKIKLQKYIFLANYDHLFTR